MSAAPLRRGVLVAAVVLAACVGLVGGALSAWGIYSHFGPTERVVTEPVKGNGGGGPTIGDIAKGASSSLAVIATHPVTAEQIAAGTAGLATGFVVSSDGLIVTSAGAVSGATALRVGLPDGTAHDAAIAGVDAAHGIVVLRAVGGVKGLTPLQFAGSAPALGDLGIAVWRQPLSGVAVGVGDVSAVGRTVATGGTPASVGDALTVDAQSQPAAEGAPLLDATGKVIGIVTVPPASASPPPGVIALSGRDAAALVGRLGGGVAVRPSLGLDSAPLDPATAAAAGMPPGALIRAVTPGGPAALAGLVPGEVVTAVNGTAVDASHDFASLVAPLQPGQRAVLTIGAAGSPSRQVTVVVGTA